ncbi:flagellar basal body L-ring protein FlgH [Pseudomethylobacillus aquaticus]|uniref:Flagellar L-ring protein n=1 Tax=Pseudomethylobacillus aquaticus TaxID=2676064 RepID=A0A3N0V014_9PROT|nr:flagellar basal body L-ring protein FlgH [Pseudomethylobacillus aquaticus]ROH86137.1 flagellar basal body L-ring protein FlgH [Pseudomethylobacillus aquaticus]
MRLHANPILIASLTASLMLALLGGCAVTPDSIVKTPMTAKPVPNEQVAGTSGSIYKAGAYRPLFEDRRARLVGDILTITISENTSANKAGTSSANKSGEVSGAIAAFRGNPIGSATMSASSDLGYEDKAASNASNNFTGNIGVTVIEVYSNGNLLVSGEKQVSFDKGTEFVRFSGVVNPDTIALGNVVPSNRVADARVEYRSGAKVDAAQIANILSRFFLSFIPL